MANGLRKTGQTNTFPERPPVPGRPAYCYTEQRIVPNVNGGQPIGDDYFGSHTANSATGSGSYATGIPQYTDKVPQYTSMWKVVSVTFCVPAVPSEPGIPGKTIVDPKTGWNAGGRSVTAVEGDAILKFTVPEKPTGVLVGFSDGRADNTFGHPTHAFAFYPDRFRIYDRGVIIFEDFFRFTNRYAMSRVGGRVTFYEVNPNDDSSLRPIVNGITPSGGTIYADATLYSVGDFVNDPSFGGNSSAQLDAFIPRLRPTIHEAEYKGVDSNIPRMVLVADMVEPQVIDGTVPLPLGNISNYSGATLVKNLPKLVLQAGTSDFVAPWSYVSAHIPRPFTSSILLTGEVLSLDNTIPTPQRLISDRPYAEAGGKWPSRYIIDVWENLWPPGTLMVPEPMPVYSTAMLDAPVLLMVTDGVEVGGTADLIMLVSLDAYDYLGLNSTFTLESTIELMIRDGLAVYSNVSTARETALQYAVNVLTGALTTYQNFGFTGFARIGNETYGIKPDGLYRLEGETDDGEMLRALIDFGADDYGVKNTKRLSSAYAGITTDGRVYFRITGDDGEERVYTLAGESPEFRTPDGVAKGIAARHWRLRLEVEDASFADLDNIEVEVGVSSRRIHRRN